MRQVSRVDHREVSDFTDEAEIVGFANTRHIVSEMCPNYLRDFLIGFVCAVAYCSYSAYV